MRWRYLILGLAMTWFGLPAAAWAILIEIEAQPANKQVGGYFVSDDGKIVEIRELAPDGKEQLKQYDRTKVKLKIIHKLDKARLEKLAKNEPKAYHDYAVELADKKLAADPEARYMARRLFLIAAYLDPQQLGHSSLLNMVSLAGTPAEAQKCRAMAFLLDPQADDKVLIREAAVKPAPMANVPNGLQDFQELLRSYRAGRIAEARAAAQNAGMDKVFSTVPGMLDQKSFVKRCDDANCAACAKKGWVTCTMCNGKKVIDRFAKPCPTCSGKGTLNCMACGGTGFNLTIPDDELLILLRAELWVAERLSGAVVDKKNTAEANWSSILQARQVSPVPLLSLVTITEIDPRKCLYRDGKWVVP